MSQARILITANADQATSELARLKAQFSTGMASIASSAKSIVGVLGGVSAAFSAIFVLGKVSSVQREFDVLNSSLITVTGSSAKAAKEFAWIQEFAATTPFQLNEVTSAFTKMKALGLDASASSLQAYGNTASAMGKSLNQMIEAVADASTGEFERLKEFGIKANKEGDRVKLTFQGVSTSIGNNAQEITQYLQAIGNNQFAGAMSLRAQTLDGAISNLADTWDGLFRAVSSQGVGGLIHDSVKLATGAVSDLTTVIRALNGVTKENAQDAGVMASAQNGIATVFETVAVLGLNVKYMLTAIRNEIGGIAAQAAAVLTLDADAGYERAKAIRKAMLEDAERNRNDVDAASRRILSARAIAKSLEGASALNEPRFARAINAANAAATQAKPAVSGLGDAAKKAAEDFEKLISGLVSTNVSGQIAAQGFTGSQAKFLELAASPAWAKLTNLQRAQVAALYEVQIGQEQSAQAVKAHKQAQEEATKAYLDGIKALDSSAQSALERLQTMRQEDEALALSTKLTISLEAATMQLSIARLQDQQVQSMGNEAAVLALEKEIKTRKEILALIGGRDAANAAKKAAEESEKLRTSEQAEWQKTWDQVSQSFTDALMKGGKSVAQYLKDLFRTLVLRPILEPIGKSFAGALGGGFGGGSGLGSIGGGGMLDGLGLGSGIASAITGGLSAGFGGLMGSIGGLFGAAGTGATLGGALSAGSIALSAGNIAAGLSTLAGALGPIGIGVALLSKAFGRGPKVTQASGISGEFSAGGADLQGFTDWTRKGGWFRSNKAGTDYSDLSQETDQFFDSSVRSLAGAARAYAQVLGMTGDAINDVTQTVRIDLKGLDEAAQQKAIQEAFVGFGDLLAQNLGVQSLEALEALASSLTSVNQVLASLGQSGFGASIAGAQGSQSLAALFGGVQQFAQSASAYLGSYFTEAERTALTTQQLTQQFAALGLAMPEGTAGLRALIEAQDINTDAGRAAYAVLMQLSPAFAGVANAATAAAQAVQQERQGIESKLLQMQGNGAEIRRRELLAIGESNRALQEQIYALEDQATAASAAADAIAKQAQAQAGLQSAIDAAIPKFFGQQEAALYQAGRIGAQVRDLGFDSFSAEQLLGFSVSDIRTYVEAQLKRLDVSDDAKAGLVQLASSLVDVRGQVEAVNTALPTLSSGISAVFGDLEEGIRRLYGSVSYTSAASVAAANQYLRAAAGGASADPEQLKTAMRVAMDGIDGKQFASGAAQDLERLRLAAVLSAIRGAAPSFDVGTNYVPRDMYAKIHEGEEIVPRKYNPAAGGQAVFAGVISALEKRVGDMVTELKEIKGHGRRAANALNGESEQPMLVKVA